MLLLLMIFFLCLVEVGVVLVMLVLFVLKYIWWMEVLYVLSYIIVFLLNWERRKEGIMFSNLWFEFWSSIWLFDVVVWIGLVLKIIFIGDIMSEDLIIRVELKLLLNRFISWMW